MEDQMATIFMGYILVFLVCHSPRLMLNIYELATIREAVECSRYVLTCSFLKKDTKDSKSQSTNFMF